MHNSEAGERKIEREREEEKESGLDSVYSAVHSKNTTLTRETRHESFGTSFVKAQLKIAYSLLRGKQMKLWTNVLAVSFTRLFVDATRVNYVYSCSNIAIKIVLTRVRIKNELSLSFIKIALLVSWRSTQTY